MINLTFSITNPFWNSDYFASVYEKHGKISEHKCWEIQGMRDDSILAVDFRITSREDHAGITLELGLVGHRIAFQIYDNRHWNYDEQRWYNYGEELDACGVEDNEDEKT